MALLVPMALGAEGPPAEARAAEYLAKIWRETGTPGISVAIMAEGRLVFSEGVGYADLDHLVPASPSTVYNVGSVSKAITAVAVLQLVERGKVDLESAIRTYVPSFPDKGSAITVRHLLTHTSGIRHYRATDFPDDPDFNQNCRPFDSLEQALSIFADDPLLFSPGAYYLYSSYAVNLLQGVVESASGLGFEEYLRRNVWGPAGMLSSTFDVPDRIVPHRARGYLVEDGSVRNHPPEDVTYKFAGGGMLGTAEDLVRLAAALDADRLLRPETRELMWTPHLDPVLVFREDGPPEREERWTQGFLWRLREDESGRRYAYASGTVKGFNAVVVDYRDDGVSVAILGNGHPVTPALREAWVFAGFFLEPDSAGRGR